MRDLEFEPEKRPWMDSCVRQDRRPSPIPGFTVTTFLDKGPSEAKRKTKKMFPRRNAFIESVVDDMVENPNKYAEIFEEAILGRIETERRAFIEGVTPNVTQEEFAARKNTALVLFQTEAESERPSYPYRRVFFLALLAQLAATVGEHKYAESALNEIQGSPEDESDKGLGIIPRGKLEKWINKLRVTIKAHQLTRATS